MRPEEIKRSICETGVRMLDGGLTSGTGGNISVFDRASGLVYITPTTMPYREITPEDLPVCKQDGTPVLFPHKPSMELYMHLNIYAARKAVNAVIHTHSPALIALAELDENPLGLPVAPPYPVGSPELAEGCFTHLGQAEAVLLRGHGAVMVGASLDEAFALAASLEREAEELIQKS